MKYILLTSILLLTACGEMKPVDGASEILVRDDFKSSTSIQPDGGRLVTIYRGETMVAIVLLPALKEKAVETNVEKGK